MVFFLQQLTMFYVIFKNLSNLSSGIWKQHFPSSLFLKHREYCTMQFTKSSTFFRNILEHTWFFWRVLVRFGHRFVPERLILDFKVHIFSYKNRLNFFSKKIILFKIVFLGKYLTTSCLMYFQKSSKRASMVSLFSSIGVDSSWNKLASFQFLIILKSKH